MVIKYTHKELDSLISELRKIYDIVRTVDAGLQRVVVFDENGRHVEEKQNCFEAWNKGGRCAECVSARAFKEQIRLSKYEFIGDDIYHVTSQYIEVDGNPCLLEIVQKDRDYSLVGTYGHDRFIKQIQGFSEQMYTDSLTGINNRKYYDDQLSALHMQAVAMVDIDYFKQFNDTYGHAIGDEVLKQVASVFRKNTRRSDMVVRYGGDEFVVGFPTIKKESLFDKLDGIRKMMEQVRINGYPELKITLSIGGYYSSAGESLEDMVRKADTALYQSKETRNKVTVHGT